MGPPSYIGSVVDRNVVVRHITVFSNKTAGHKIVEARNRDINVHTVKLALPIMFRVGMFAFSDRTPASTNLILQLHRRCAACQLNLTSFVHNKSLH
jgi:hypothetical protein